MQTVNVRFQNVSQICEFINIIDKCDANFGLGSGKNWGTGIGFFRSVMLGIRF